MQIKMNLSFEQLQDMVAQLPYEKKVSLIKNVLGSQEIASEQSKNYQNLLDEIAQKNGQYDDSLAYISSEVLSN